MVAWVRSKRNLDRVEAVQITPIEFEEEVLRNNATYIRPFRKAAQDLVKLSTVTYPLTGGEPGWDGQETVRGHVIGATKDVDTVMEDFIAHINEGSEGDQLLTVPALQVVLSYMRLRAEFNSYLEARIAIDPSIWSFEIKRPDVPSEIYIWGLISRLWETVKQCCVPTIQNGDDAAYQWIFNGRYDEEAQLWTMKPQDTKLRTQILGAMMEGLNNLRKPADELIEDIRTISIQKNFPASTYEPLSKIVDQLNVIIQAFIDSLWGIRLGMSGLLFEFNNRFEKED
ncbi:hypothetical protein TWF506_003290 [Arthrobotrys conoides]|uniref:Uncharacterized protein n=1 Tax=Arthrobotrys conoides TaxID=74498 RepID=A0AAN8N4Q6_9PEZI